MTAASAPASVWGLGRRRLTDDAHARPVVHVGQQRPSWRGVRDHQCRRYGSLDVR